MGSLKQSPYQKWSHYLPTKGGNRMKSRIYVGLLAALAILVLLSLLTGCAKKEEMAKEEQLEEPAATEDEVVFTRNDPGAWGGKEDTHVPQIVYEQTDTGLKVTVSVSHEMNAETPHYIMWIKLKDGEDNLLGEKEFQASDEKAEAVFDLTVVPSKLKAFQKCNLHGQWMDEVDVTI